MATAAPASARAMAVARPMPDPPPVTRATLLSRSFTSPCSYLLAPARAAAHSASPGGFTFSIGSTAAWITAGFPLAGPPPNAGPPAAGRGPRPPRPPNPPPPPPPPPPLGALLHPVRSVHGHDGRDGQLVAGGGLQLLHIEPEGAVPADGADRPVGRSQLGPNSEGKPRPQVPGVGCPQHGALLPHEEVVCRPDAGVAA